MRQGALPHTGAVVGNGQPDAMEDCRKPDGHIGGVGMPEGVIEGDLRGPVQKGCATGRNLKAVVRCLPVDTGALPPQRNGQPVNAARESKPVEVSRRRFPDEVPRFGNFFDNCWGVHVDRRLLAS
jgi:hypothetical protein